MVFDKIKYWKNRSDGKRGQGEIEHPTVAHDDATHKVGQGFMGMNRQQGRRKVVKKFYRDADDKIGVRHTRKGAPHRTPRPSIWGLTHTPSEDSTKSNHQRHIERQKTRELASH